MARQFLTGIDLNKNELLNARIQNLSTAPSSPVAGQMYYNTGDNTLRYWNGTSWLTLAQGGDLAGAISAAIDALTTDDIEEGEDNLYYTSTRARSDAAALLTSATFTNIDITGDGDGLTITAENGVADSTTDDLTEGTTNLYFTDQRALDATESAYDAAGAAGDVASDLSTHEGLSSGVHGTTGSVVGTSDTQELTNKTIGSTGLGFVNGGQTATISASNDDLQVAASGNISLVTSSGDILLDADGDVYKGGSATAGNELITQGKLDQYIGDATVDGSSGNTITDRIDSAAQSALGDAQAYADALVPGLNVKDSVRVATTAAKTLANDFADGSVIDGVTLATGDRILIKNQATASENGIYVVEASGAPTRAADADPVADELNKGTYVLVTEGTYAATGWIVTGYSAGATTWTQFSAANEYTAGDGIDITSNEISVALDGASLSVSSSGLRAQVAEGGGLNIDSTYGLYAQIGTGLAVNASSGDIEIDTANGYGVRKYAASNPELTPSGGVVTWTVTHNITNDSVIQVFDKATGATVEVDVVRTSTTVATLSWAAAATVSATAYRVVVIG
jgi:hypothetical protein